MSKTVSSPRIRQLPVEIEGEVLRHLDGDDLARYSQVDRRAHAISSQPAMWKERLAKEYPSVDVRGLDPRQAYGALFEMERSVDRAEQRTAIVHTARAVTGTLGSMAIVPAMLVNAAVSAVGMTATAAASAGVAIGTSPLGLISPMIPMTLAAAVGVGGVSLTALASAAVVMPALGTAAVADSAGGFIGEAIAERMPAPPRSTDRRFPRGKLVYGSASE